MKQFIFRTIRNAAIGTVCGALFVLILHAAVAFEQPVIETFRHRFLQAFVQVKNLSHILPLLSVLLVGVGILTFQSAKSFAQRLYRSWSVGLVSALAPVWFSIVSYAFLLDWPLSMARILVVSVAAVLSIVLSWLVFRRQREPRLDGPILIPEQPLDRLDIPLDRALEFDLPIQAWKQDRLRRGKFVKSIAELILKDQAPVVGIVGPFGEGKTSTLNLLAQTLRPRSDSLVIRFSSWLPGDPRALAISFFETIGSEIRKRYLVFGLSSELRRFARLLAGAIPKLGESLSQFFDPPSQVDQISKIERLLGRLPVRVVVLIDEIDRMDRDELLILLKAIRGVPELPNLTYVCGFNADAVERLISPEDRPYGRFYLEKFFPQKFALPRIESELLGQIFDQSLKAICDRFGPLKGESESEKFKEAISTLWKRSLRKELTNFRKMSLFFNSVQVALEPVAREVCLFDMLVLQLVKSVSPRTFEFIYDNGPVFYDANLRIKFWEEQLHVDEKRDATLRKQSLDAHLQSVPQLDRAILADLLGTIFPSLRKAMGDGTSLRGVYDSTEDEADRLKRIYHPDYFPSHFIHQVPSDLFGQEEMFRFVGRLNKTDDAELIIREFQNTFGNLSPDSWKRWDFLRNLVFAVDGLGDPQAKALVSAITLSSDSMGVDTLGIGEWGRARVIIFQAAQRFSGTPTLQALLITAIDRSLSDGFAADIMRFSVDRKDQNKIITDWTNVDEAAVRAAFSSRMRRRYAVGSEHIPKWGSPEHSWPFFAWAGMSGADRDAEIQYFRDRFQRDPSEIGKFLNWIVPRNGLFENDPILVIEKLFPVDELIQLLDGVQEDQQPNREAEAIRFFRQQIENRHAG